MSYQTITAVNAQALTVSGGATPSVSTTLEIEDSVSQLYVYAKNLGNSTSLTVSIYASSDNSGTIKALIQTLTLNATTTTMGAVPVSVPPKYLIITATNADAANATTYTIVIGKRA